MYESNGDPAGLTSLTVIGLAMGVSEEEGGLLTACPSISKAQGTCLVE